MTREIKDNLEFRMLLIEALDLGIISAMECGHVKCLTDKIEAYYYNLAVEDQEKQLEFIENLISKIKSFIEKQKMIEDIEFKKFNDNILAESKRNVLKFIDEYNEQEARGPQMG